MKFQFAKYQLKLCVVLLFMSVKLHGSVNI